MSSRAIRTEARANLEHEFSDVVAWVTSLANLLDVDLAGVMERYADGCAPRRYGRSLP